jgi:glycosyltransferase involved in cell wall biosynthesis
MNILIINHYIGSSRYGMDYRQYYLAREWVKMGHDVTILGASFSHLRIQQPDVRKNLQEEWVEGIRYVWIKTPSYSNSGFRRIFNMVAFILKAIWFYPVIAKRYKPKSVFVASTYVLDIYPGWLISKRSGARLIYELHDLWPLSPMLIGGYHKYHPFILMVQAAENFACHRCDYFISVLVNAKEYLVAHGMHEDRFVYVSNGFSEEHFQSARKPIPVEHLKLFETLRVKQKIVVGYTGGHAPSNALESFILAAKKLAFRTEIAFVLVGTGSQKEELIKLANSHEQESIFFLTPVTKDAIPDLLSRCDILYAGGGSSVLHQYGTAFNKITDYMLAGKPIVFAVDDPHSVVEQVECGIQVGAEHVEAISDAIRKLAQMSVSQREAIGIKGREYAERELGYSSIARKILEVTGD